MSKTVFMRAMVRCPSSAQDLMDSKIVQQGTGGFHCHGAGRYPWNIDDLLKDADAMLQSHEKFHAEQISWRLKEAFS